MTPFHVNCRPTPAFRGIRAQRRPTELCQLAGRWAGRVLEAGTLVEEKRDGFRCLFFPGVDRVPALWTRNGIPMPGAGHILARLLEVEQQLGGQWMIDGEFQVGGTLAATKAHYDSGWRDGDAGTFYAFDCVPLADWERGRCDIPLYERKAALVGAIEATAPRQDDWEWRPGSRGKDHGIDPLSPLTDQWLFTADDIRAEASRVWAAGGEGLMIKDAQAPYIRARSDAWQKLKRAGVA